MQFLSALSKLVRLATLFPIASVVRLALMGPVHSPNSLILLFTGGQAKGLAQQLAAVQISISARFKLFWPIGRHSSIADWYGPAGKRR